MEKMQLKIVELVVRCFKDGDNRIHRIFSVANSRFFVAAEVVVIEKLAPCGGDSEYEESGKIVKPDVNIDDGNKDWNLECIMTAEEVEATGLQSKMRAL